MRRGAWIVSALVLGVGSVACDNGGAPPSGAPASATAESSSPVATVTSQVPSDFANRPSLPRCGTYDHRPLVRKAAPPSPSPLACFERAIGSAEGAELVVTKTTYEGDVIPTYLRALPGSAQIEFFSDSTQDGFGTKVWTRQVCTGLDRERLSPSGCSGFVEYLARSIVGAWIPREIGDDFPRSVPSAVEHAVRFDQDGTWRAGDRCDGTVGTFTVDAVGTFAASPTGPRPTDACDRGGVTAALERTTKIVLTVDRLRLLGSTGDILGDFVPGDRVAGI